MAELNENQKLTVTGSLPVESKHSLEITTLKATRYYSQLTIEQKEHFELIVNKVQVKDIPKNEFITQMDKLVIFIHSCCAQQMDVDNHELSLFPLCADIQRYWGFLTFEEVKVCFNKGYKGENGGFGKYYGLCNASYFSWLEAFVFSENRQKAVKAIGEAKEFILNPPPPPPTEEEVEQSKRRCAIDAWNTVKENKELFDINNFVYDYLNGLKLILFTATEKKEMLEKVREEMVLEQKAKLVSPDMLHAKTTKELIDGFRFGIDDPNQRSSDGQVKKVTHPLILSATKRHALKALFTQMIEMDVNFVELLDKAIDESKK